MRNVKQKIMGSMRTTWLTLLALVVSCAWSGLALAQLGFEVGPNSHEGKGYTSVEAAGDYTLSISAKSCYGIKKSFIGAPWDSEAIWVPTPTPMQPRTNYKISIPEPKDGLAVTFNGVLVPTCGEDGEGTPPEYTFKGSVQQIRLRVDANNDGSIGDPDDDLSDPNTPGKIICPAEDGKLIVQVRLKGLAAGSSYVPISLSSSNLYLTDSAGNEVTQVDATEGDHTLNIRLREEWDESQPLATTITGKLTTTDGGVTSDTTKATGIYMNLTAHKVVDCADGKECGINYGAALPDDEEEDPGVYLLAKTDPEDEEDEAAGTGGTEGGTGEASTSTGGAAGTSGGTDPDCEPVKEYEPMQLIIDDAIPSGLQGYFVLNVGGPIRVWKDKAMTIPLESVPGEDGEEESGSPYKVDGAATVYLEGTGAGGGEITHFWTNGTLVKECGDKIKVTVFSCIDLDVDSNDDGSITKEDDAIETLKCPGPKFCLNVGDKDQDGIDDRIDWHIDCSELTEEPGSTGSGLSLIHI